MAAAQNRRGFAPLLDIVGVNDFVYLL